MQGACLTLRAPWGALAMQTGSIWLVLMLPEHAARCPEHCSLLAPADTTSQVSLITNPYTHAYFLHLHAV